jgi:hypothetical protein
MKTTTRAQNIKVTTRYNASDDVTFMIVKWGIVTLQGSVAGHGVPDVWRMWVGDASWGKCTTREVRDHSLRGRCLEAMIKAMRVGRI